MIIMLLLMYRCIVMLCPFSKWDRVKKSTMCLTSSVLRLLLVSQFELFTLKFENPELSYYFLHIFSKTFGPNWQSAWPIAPHIALAGTLCLSKFSSSELTPCVNGMLIGQKDNLISYLANQWHCKKGYTPATGRDFFFPKSCFNWLLI